MSLLDNIKRWWTNTMTSVGFNNSDMFYDENVNTWYDIYFNNASWLTGYVRGMNLAKSIVEEVSRTTLNEFNFEVKSEDKNIVRTSEYIKNNYKNIVNHLCVGGNVALKPFITNSRVGVTIVSQKDFKATYNSFDELVDIWFKNLVKSKGKYYVLLENHKWNYDNTYEIHYELREALYTKGYDENSVPDTYGRILSLSECEETANLKDVMFSNIDKHLCCVIPLNNTLNSKKGQAIFADAITNIEDADRLLDMVLWEYEGGQLAVDADSQLFMTKGNKNYIMPAGKERLYRKLENTDNGFNIETFAPELRDTNYWNGLNRLLRLIETSCGLSYGILSDPQNVDKTATEVISSNQRFYSTISYIRDRLVYATNYIIGSVDVLSKQVTPAFIHTGFSIEYDFEDGILTNSKDKFDEMMALLDKQLITSEQFMDWYHSKYRKSNKPITGN